VHLTAAVSVCLGSAAWLFVCAVRTEVRTGRAWWIGSAVVAGLNVCVLVWSVGVVAARRVRCAGRRRTVRGV
jgi:hypothetical protein